MKFASMRARRCVTRLALVMLIPLMGLPVLAAYGATEDTRYDPIILSAAQQHGLEPALIKSVIHCESRFNALARSPRGAQGLMQLMPSTQALLGVPDAFDPAHNIVGGSRYLSMLKRQFNDDMTLMLAAYNAGPQAVVNAGYQIPPYTETQGYVRCVYAALEDYRRHGLQHLFRNPRLAETVPEASGMLTVKALRFSDQRARLGKRLTIEIEAVNTSKQPADGMIMLNYPEYLVSFLALNTQDNDTAVQLSSASQPVAAAQANAYRLLWRQWPVWRPGERRTATIALVPRVPQDITLQLNVVLTPSAQQPSTQRWSRVLRIPFATTTW